MWQGEFGNEYTKRNLGHVGTYTQRYGVTRQEMNEEFVGFLDRNIRVLEVGCNAGDQMLLLEDMGFIVYGIDINDAALDIAIDKRLEVFRVDATDTPFNDNSFDLVYTSGLLIHIPPEDLRKVLREIYRISKKYIWGFEYYNNECKEIKYRGFDRMLWKGNYVQEYLDILPLKLLKEKKYKYLDNDNVDSMFLLEKI